jgi:hypothetical protein
MSLLPKEARRRILERGLLSGLWSVGQFNSRLLPWMEATLPNWDFLDSHPQFTDMDHRDLEAFHSRHEHPPVI